jgi:hypothetical protein
MVAVALYGCSAATRVGAAPVDEAKKLVKRMAAVKGPSDIPPLLTRETAAGMAGVLSAVLAMGGGMADAMVGMSEGNAGGAGSGGAKPKPDPAQAAKIAKLRALSSDIKAVFKKYGLGSGGASKPPTPAQRARIVKSGREFLADVLRVAERMPNSGKGDNGLTMDRKKMERIQYRPISATRVQLVDPDSPGEQAEARLEDGAWRFHMVRAARMLDGKGVTP